MNICLVDDCKSKVYGRGMCNKHYARWRRNGTTESSRTYGIGRVCSVEVCNDLHDSNGYCKKHARMLRLYGINPSEYENMFLSQGGKCAICLSNGKKLVIDHNHSCCSEKSKSCGKCIRGLLCSKCNTSIGAFEDNINILKNAIQYLENNK